jgi:hypothetical protein
MIPTLKKVQQWRIFAIFYMTVIEIYLNRNALGTAGDPKAVACSKETSLRKEYRHRDKVLQLTSSSDEQIQL